MSKVKMITRNTPVATGGQANKAIAVIRCSSKPQFEKYGPSSQLRDVEEGLQHFQNGRVELCQTIEIQEPASGWNRKKWELTMRQCLEAYKRGEADMIVFPRVDRETRFLAGSFATLLEVVKAGILVYFAQRCYQNLEHPSEIPISWT